MTNRSQLTVTINSIQTSTIGEMIDVVVEIGYTITLDLEGQLATVDGFAFLDPFNIDPDNFLEFNQISEAQATQWVLDRVGTERLDQIASQLTDEINQQPANQIRPVVRNLPWA
jgi:hypothetical protein